MELENCKFLEKFEDVEILDGGNSSEGKPTLIYAKYHGIEKFIKYWEKKQNSLSPELELLWLDEIRQLQRLNGYPNPENHIAYLDHSAKDDSGFYLVLETDGRLPLPYTNSKWLASVLQNEDHRIKFWKNIIRIVRAIDFLHSQGLLHRNIDRFSVLTGDDTNNNNFQLSGFEWSIRIQAFKDGRSINVRSSATNEKMYSFSNDWYGLGVLILDLLKIQYDSISNIGQPASIVSQNTNLSIREVSLIRALLGIIKIESSISNEALNGQIIEEHITSKIIRFIDRKELTPFDIIFSFSTFPTDLTANPRAKVGLYTAIRDRYSSIQESIPDKEDIISLTELVRIDLSEKPVLFLLNSNTEINFLLKGKHLIYLLEPNKISRQADKTWDAAFCKSAFREMPESLKNNEYSYLDSQSIKIWSNNSRDQKLSFRSWEFFLEKLGSDQMKKTTEQQELIDGLIAFHLTEMAYARTEIFPVTILGTEESEDNPGYRLLKLISCQNTRFEDLGQVFDIDPPAKRLKQNLENDIYDSGWILTAKDNFQDDDESIELTFLELNAENGKDIFMFRMKDSGSIDSNSKLFIIPSSSEGTIRQLNRRAKALELLDKHLPLINTLIDPHSQIQNSAEAHLIQNIDEHLKKLNINLDDSKKIAFKNALHTLPLYLVQGPPGVGKTYLATAIIKHIFSQDSESRVLITAQSHSTVEHIYQEVTKGMENNLKPLIVKCIKSSQNNGSDTKAALDEQAREMLTKLIGSNAYLKSTNEHLKRKIASSAKIDERWQRYSLMNHLLRAANLVFTTTNSKHIEDMLINRAQFDWSIMEEAGKVTGIELISPLLLSHRKLMIGDHLQLPPHRSKEVQRILDNPEKLYSAIQSAIDGKKRPVKGDSTGSRIEELRRIGPDKAIALKKIGSSAAKTHLLFEMLIKIEDERAKRIAALGLQSNHKPIASMLTEQYRMHPLIADITSDIFYNPDKGKSLNKLTSAKATTDFFQKNERPFFWEYPDTLNQSKPIVWIDLPDVMQKQYATEFKDEPRWTNSKECEAIITILKSLRPKHLDKKPKLAILTAYSSQKIMIENEIRSELSGELSHLTSFSKPDDHDSFCSTIHSFQGAEADLVILSMVRNNIKDTARGAFGFFLDEQLFNVMLSRARFQLVIVGSFNFYKRWIGKNDFVEKKEYQFLVDLVNKLETLNENKDATFINYTK